MTKPDHSDRIENFLKGTEWSGAQLARIAGDMSSRRYHRVSQDGHTAVLMDADSDMTPFRDMTDWLANLGLSVPGIMAADARMGLLLLEDLGNTSMKAAVESNPELRAVAFDHCVDILLRIRHAEPPPLSAPEAPELVAWTQLVEEHLPGMPAAGLAAFRQVLLKVLTDVLDGERTVSLRDFHSENVMWLPEREGWRRLGLLDYQDAFLTHPAYDLVSLLTDARMWITASERQETIDLYLERSGDERESFERAVAAFSAQRNLRILGVFARAGKSQAQMQNTVCYFLDALEHPVFASVKAETRAALPAHMAAL